MNLTLFGINVEEVNRANVPIPHMRYEVFLYHINLSEMELTQWLKKLDCRLKVKILYFKILHLN